MFDKQSSVILLLCFNLISCSYTMELDQPNQKKLVNYVILDLKGNDCLPSMLDDFAALITDERLIVRDELNQPLDVFHATADIAQKLLSKLNTKESKKFILAGDNKIFQNFVRLRQEAPALTQIFELSCIMDVTQIRLFAQYCCNDYVFGDKKENTSLDRAHAILEELKFYRYRYLNGNSPYEFIEEKEVEEMSLS